MPIYAFECTACGHSFDRLQKLSDPDPSACPACATGAIKRQLTAPSFRLSGSGWYETDFKKDGDRKRNLAGEGGEGAKAGAESRADQPAAAKPDANAGAKPKAESKVEPKAPGTAAGSPAAAKPGPKPAAG